MTPGNNDCANAITVSDGVTPFSSIGATGVDITSCAFNDANDIWYAYTATCTGEVEINTCGSLFDTVLALFDACGGSELACNDDSCDLQSQITASVTLGTTYLIRISGFNGETGEGVLTISCGEPAPCTVVPPAGVDTSSPAYAEVIATDPFCCFNEWDEFCQAAYDDLTGGGGCTVVPPAGVDTSSPAYQQVIADDPFCCNTEWDEFCQAAYDDLTGGGGTPVNDDCANATPVSDGVTPFSTIGATGVDITSCALDDANDIWFAYTATCTGDAVFNTCGSLFDTVLAIFDACGGTELGCNDDFCGLQSQLVISVTEGTTYLVRVAGYDGETGIGELTISCGEPADCPVVPPVGVDTSSPAYQQVIADDPFCCFNEWDEICQAAYDDLTGGGGSGYCTAGADGTGLGLDERITNVAFADINNSSPNVTPVAPAYQDFTSVVGNVTVGESYPIAISVNSSIGSSYNTNQVLVWIDLNGDEDFDDAGELVFTSDIGAVEVYEGNITIPPGTTLGTTRMRIRLHDTHDGSQYINIFNNTPCGIASYGEVEDYTLVIDLSTRMDEEVAATWLVFPNPNRGDFTVRAHGVDGAVELELYDMTGRRVHMERPVLTSGADHQVALGGQLAQGAYLLRITNGEQRFEQRIVVH